MTPLETLRYTTRLVKAQCRYDRFANRGNNGWQMRILAPGETGDCDSYQYTLGTRLIAQGFPPEHISFWTFTNWRDEDHAVLEVKLPDGTRWYADATDGTVTKRNPPERLKNGIDITWAQAVAKHQALNPPNLRFEEQ